MRKTAFFIYLFLIFLLGSTALQAQQPAAESGRFVGVVVDGSTKEAVPHATIKNKTRNKSVLADSTGYFVLEVNARDTVVFEAMSYQNDFYVVPADFAGREFAFIEVLQRNAVLLDEVEVKGFPSQEQFEAIFMAADGAGEVVEKTARLNERLEEIAEDETNMQAYLNEVNGNQMIYQLKNFPPNLHNPRPNNFLNPIRWARFISDWREGRFSEDAIEKLNEFPNPSPAGETGNIPEVDDQR